MARRGENIYKRKDGRYEGRYIKGYDACGKAKYGYVYSSSYGELKKKLICFKSGKAVNNTGSDICLESWLNLWLAENREIKETTRQIYKGHIKNHIAPVIGSIKLKSLNAAVLQGFANSLRLSPSTVNVVFGCVKSALKKAEDMGLITDVWSRVKLPKKIKTETLILTQSQQLRLEKALSDEQDIGILICLYMGLRIGELCALKWSDIDFENSVMNIKRTQARVGSEIIFTTPKSTASIRKIPIPEIIAGKLKACRHDSEFVISKNGSYVDVRVYRRRFKALLKKADLPDVRFHALRHTFSSRALEVGMDFKTLSEILGHSNVSITLNLYVHSLYEHKKAEMNKLNKLYDYPS